MEANKLVSTIALDKKNKIIKKRAREKPQVIMTFTLTNVSSISWKNRPPPEISKGSI